MYTSQWASMAPILAEGYPADAMFGFKYAGLNDKGEALGVFGKRRERPAR